MNRNLGLHNNEIKLLGAKHELWCVSQVGIWLQLSFFNPFGPVAAYLLAPSSHVSNMTRFFIGQKLSVPSGSRPTCRQTPAVEPQRQVRLGRFSPRLLRDEHGTSMTARSEAPSFLLIPSTWFNGLNSPAA